MARTTIRRSALGGFHSQWGGRSGKETRSNDQPFFMTVGTGIRSRLAPRKHHACEVHQYFGNHSIRSIAKKRVKRRYKKMHANYADSRRLNDLSRLVSGCTFTVLNTLGAGFLEKIYENALAHELRAANLAILQQPAVKVFYNDVVVGEYFPDILVESMLLVELKTVAALSDMHRAQCTSYLKATGLRLCLLLNFGKSSLEIKRVAHGL